MDNYLGSIISLKNEEKNYYIIGFIYKNGDIFSLILIKFYFTYDNSGNLVYKEVTKKEFLSLDKKIVNCYLKTNNIIICLYVANNSNYKILFLDTNLGIEDEKELSIVSPTSTVFFKFFHLKDNIDIFIYYQGIENDYPIIQLIETIISDDTYSINLTDNILLNKYFFNNSVTLTDIIKIRDNLICISATTPNKEVLIIILVNFFTELGIM